MDEMAINAVVEPLMKKDKRIKYFRHTKNEGVAFNFKFLVEQSTGEFFMWLADDDERHETCVETCLQLIGSQGGAFGTYEVSNRYHKTTYVHKVPRILNKMSLQKRLSRFIAVFPSVYIYGLYRRKYLDFFLKEKTMFDFYDGYFAMHILINYGLNVCPTKHSIIILGVNEESYVPKPFEKTKNKMFTYTPVIKKCTDEIWNANLNIFQKVFLTSFFLLHMTKHYVTYEHPYRVKAKILNFTIRLPLRYVYRTTKNIFGFN